MIFEETQKRLDVSIKLIRCYTGMPTLSYRKDELYFGQLLQLSPFVMTIMHSITILPWHLIFFV